MYVAGVAQFAQFVSEALAIDCLAQQRSEIFAGSWTSIRIVTRFGHASIAGIGWFVETALMTGRARSAAYPTVSSPWS